jgi:uncharacterized iron-regulated membrane protein
MSRKQFRRWFVVHKWASLLCTLFILVSCLTGLPLVFNDEIADVLDDGLPFAQLPADAPRASLDTLIASSRGLFPGEAVLSVFVDDDEPKVVVSMAPSWDAYRKDLKAAHWIRFDARTSQVLKTSRPFDADGPSFLGVVFTLHKELFAGLSGELFMGAMGVSFVIAVVSGLVIYTPFMRRLDFGEIRKGRSRRTAWLDLHNFLGAVAACWLVVVGLTGVLNALSKPLFGIWQQTDVVRLLAPFQGQATPSSDQLPSAQAAFDRANKAQTGMAATSIIFPGSPFGTPFHYVIWTKGKTALMSRLFSPVLIDARSGELSATVTMPWYLRALELSRPLHFGDYGGTPLKIIWALLDLVSIAVLGSGLYLWLSRRASSPVASEAEAELRASRATSVPAIQHGVPK